MFDYLGVILSIIFGLALTHILLGVSKLIEARHEVRIYWVQLVWGLTIVIYVLALWFGMYWWHRLETWTFGGFMYLALFASVVFMLATMLFPHEIKPGTDFEAYFFANKQWFFGTFMLTWLLDVPETVAKSVDGLRSVPAAYMLFLPAMLVFTGIALVTGNRRIHAILSVSVLATSLAYMTVTALSRIAVR